MDSQKNILGKWTKSADLFDEKQVHFSQLTEKYYEALKS